MKENPIKIFMKISRPILLIGGIGQYLLGVGIAKYLGKTIDWNIFWIGIAWIVSTQWLAHLLYDYFEISKKDDPKQISKGGKQAIIGAGLALNSILLILLIRSGQFNLPVGLITVLIFFVGFFYVIAPFRLIFSGFAEIAIAIVFGNLIPSFAYLLQLQEMNRIVMLISIPLLFLILASQLALGFQTYPKDIKNNIKILLSRLGWENGMFLHNSSILIAFIVLGLAGIFGLPSAIVLPAFLPLPLGLLQIVHMRQISSGAKPNWRFLRFNAIVLVGLMSYIFTYIFWNR